jgi:membrane protein DedA with SNARE-associated domain
MGAGLPALGDASLIAAGTLAGEGRLNAGIVVAVSVAGWMLGSLAGYEIGSRGGSWLLERPGWLERSRLKLNAAHRHGDEGGPRPVFSWEVMLGSQGCSAAAGGW